MRNITIKTAVLLAGTLSSCLEIPCENQGSTTPESADSSNLDMSATDIMIKNTTKGWRLIQKHDYTREPCPYPWVKDDIQQVCIRQSCCRGNKNVKFSIGGFRYSAVKVVLTARMMASNGAFGYDGRGEGRGPDPLVHPDVPYADGIGVFSDYQHLWTFAHGQTGPYPMLDCPQSDGAVPPLDVGSNYDCIAGGTNGYWIPSYNAREVISMLPVNSTSDITVAIMADNRSDAKDSGIRYLEIWVLAE